MIRLLYIFASATGASAAAAPPKETSESDLTHRRCVIHWRSSNKKGLEINVEVDGKLLIIADLFNFPLQGWFSKRNENGTYSIKIEPDCPNFKLFQAQGSAYETAIRAALQNVKREDFGLLYNIQNIKSDPSLNGQTAMEVQLDKSGNERWKI